MRQAVCALLLAASLGVCVAQEVAPTLEPEQRMALARGLAQGGDVAGAATIWRELADEAGARGDEQALDEAQRQLAQLAFHHGQYADFEHLQQGLLARAQRRGDLRGIAAAQVQLAVLERRRGRFEQALEGFERALAQFRALGDRDGEADVLTHMSLVQLNQGAYSRALEALDRSFELQREGAKAELDRTFHYFGLLYLGLREFGVARDYLQRGLQEAERSGDPVRTSPLLGSLARVANEQGLHGDALDFARRTADMARRHDNRPGLVYSALEQGRALLGLGRLDAAREALREAERLGSEISQDRTVADARFTLGRLALREGRPEEALALFEQAFPSYSEANDVPQVLESYRMMVPLLRERGEHERALQLSEASLRLQEQISGRDMNRRLALLEYRHQSEASARQIELLTRDNEIQALRLREVYLVRRFGLVLLAGLITLSIVLGIRYRESRRHARHLAEVNAALLSSRESLAEAHRELEQRNAALYRSSVTDALTGVANRGHLFERLDAALAAAAGAPAPVAALLFDVDHFKRVNDEHGHIAGDAVLRRVARAVASLLPESALFGRFGGEEFLVVLPGWDTGSALELGERIRAAVANARDAEGPAVTISLGVASAPLGTASDRLVDAADQALYRAKRQGRNRVEAGALGAPVSGARLH